MSGAQIRELLATALYSGKKLPSISKRVLTYFVSLDVLIRTDSENRPCGGLAGRHA